MDIRRGYRLANDNDVLYCKEGSLHITKVDKPGRVTAAILTPLGRIDYCLSPNCCRMRQFSGIIIITVSENTAGHGRHDRIYIYYIRTLHKLRALKQ